MSGPRSKLNGIYSALDAGSPKQALRLCDSALVKDPGNAQCLALRALSLDRLRRSPLALAAAEDIASKSPTNMDVLYYVSTVFRNNGRHGACKALYERAVALLPESEDALKGLYEANVACADLVGMRQTAIKLFAKFHKGFYLLWALAANLLHAGAEGHASAMASLLARKLPPMPGEEISKPAGGAPNADEQEDKLRHWNAVLVIQLSILRQASQWEAAVALLDDNLRWFLTPSQALSARLQLLAESGDWSNALTVARALVNSQRFELGHFQALIALTDAVGSDRELVALYREFADLESNHAGWCGSACLSPQPSDEPTRPPRYSPPCASLVCASICVAGRKPGAGCAWKQCATSCCAATTATAHGTPQMQAKTPNLLATHTTPERECFSKTLAGRPSCGRQLKVQARRRIAESLSRRKSWTRHV
eukprot:GHVT01062789.1.p1 GENE.GHVT01062789.1~~GHVT01062789.1.p1  ORF type:complete len:425 (+),score=95.28 GHVT01062789.1:376-1650(+)